MKFHAAISIIKIMAPRKTICAKVLAALQIADGSIIHQVCESVRWHFNLVIYCSCNL